MRSLEKLWTIVYTIHEAQKITPKGKPVRVDPRISLYPILDNVSIENVFDILENDEKVIMVLNNPMGMRVRVEPDENLFVLEIKPKFEQYMNELYTRYSFGVDKLDALSLLRVYDVVLDVQDELQLTDENKVIIRLIPPLIRYQQLFPADTIGMRDEYCRHRWNAIKFLTKIGALADYQIGDRSGHRWESSVIIKVNRIEFDKIHEKLQEKYRVAFGGKKKEELLPQPTFDEKNGIIRFKGKSCEIAHGTCEYFIAKLTFIEFGEKVTEQAVVDAWGQEDKKRSVYHAHRRHNCKCTPPRPSYIDCKY